MPDSLTVNHTEQLAFPEIVWERASDYSYLSEALSRLELKHKCVRVTGIGESRTGRTVYAVTLGNRSAPGVLYAGGIADGDTQSPAALLRFVSDYAEFLEKGKRMYGVSMTYLNTSRSLTVIPMLNPDGYIREKDRNPSLPVRKNDLMRDFETACREPESCAVTGYVRTMGNTELCIGLHPAEKGISYDPAAHRAVPVGRLLSRMIGCEVEKTPWGMAQWFSRETGKPAYTCSTFGDSGARPDDYITLYAAMREAFFSVPLLI